MTAASVAVNIDGQWRTPQVSELTWTRTVPGGCLSAEVTFPEPAVAERVIPDNRVIISMPSTGKVLWDGDVRDPGQRTRSGRRDGQVTVGGSMLRLADRKWRLPYVVTGPGPWVDEDSDRKTTGSVEDVQGEVSQESRVAGDGNTLLSLRLKARGQWLDNWRVRARLTSFDDADLTIGAFLLSETSGFAPVTAAQWRFQVIVGGLSDGYVPISHPPEIYAPSQSAFASAGSSTFPTGENLLRVELKYEAATTLDINVDSYRVDLSNICVVASRVNVFGNPTSLSWAGQAATENIVADAFGRSGVVDGSLADIHIGETFVDQLDFQDPVALSDVLNALLAFEPSFMWEILPSADTLHPATWGPWPTTARYVLSQATGTYTETVREDEVYNKVTVAYRDKKGRQRSIYAIADPDTYPDVRPLADAGRIREPDPIELTAGGSFQNAVAVVNALLPDLAQAKVSATYGTGRPVLDLATGVYVHPWEVEPGNLAIVQETGETHRITQTVCDGIAGTTNLTLGSPARTAEQVIASMNRRRRKVS